MSSLLRKKLDPFNLQLDPHVPQLTNEHGHCTTDLDLYKTLTLILEKVISLQQDL